MARRGAWAIVVLQNNRDRSAKKLYNFRFIHNWVLLFLIVMGPHYQQFLTKRMAIGNAMTRSWMQRRLEQKGKEKIRV